jgi:hypothetical protein
MAIEQKTGVTEPVLTGLRRGLEATIKKTQSVAEFLAAMRASRRLYRVIGRKQLGREAESTPTILSLRQLTLDAYVHFYLKRYSPGVQQRVLTFAEKTADNLAIQPNPTEEQRYFESMYRTTARTIEQELHPTG